MLSLASANLAYVGAPAMPVSQRAAAPVMESIADLKKLAKDLNPGACQSMEPSDAGGKTEEEPPWSQDPSCIRPLVALAPPW